MLPAEYVVGARPAAVLGWADGQRPRRPANWSIGHGRRLVAGVGTLVALDVADRLARLHGDLAGAGRARTLQRAGDVVLEGGGDGVVTGLRLDVPRRTAGLEQQHRWQPVDGLGGEDQADVVDQRSGHEIRALVRLDDADAPVEDVAEGPEQRGGQLGDRTTTGLDDLHGEHAAAERGVPRR